MWAEIYVDEWYPVYTLWDRETEDSIKIDPYLFQEYTELMIKFNAMQNKLAKIMLDNSPLDLG